MLDSIFNTAAVDSGLSVQTSIITLAVALLLGVLISLTYMKTHTSGVYSPNFSVTVVMIPVILAVIILFVGSNVARAFSLAGTVAIIRFRSAPGDPKDIGYIFFAMAAGLACGVGLYLYGALFTIVLCAVMFVLYKIKYGEKRTQEKLLKIVIPEDLDYEGVFDDVFAACTASHKLRKVRTTDLGSLYELVYTVTMKQEQNEKAFIDALRCRNGNLNIVLSMTPEE
jgi:hypothetical protein